MFNLFRLKHRPLTDGPLAVAERIVREEVDRRESAFESAMVQMQRPFLTTEQILEIHLATVMADEQVAS